VIKDCKLRMPISLPHRLGLEKLAFCALRSRLPTAWRSRSTAGFDPAQVPFQLRRPAPHGAGIAHAIEVFADIADSSLMFFKLTFGCSALPCHTPLDGERALGPGQHQFFDVPVERLVDRDELQFAEVVVVQDQIVGDDVERGRSRKGASSFFPGVASAG